MGFVLQWFRAAANGEPSVNNSYHVAGRAFSVKRGNRRCGLRCGRGRGHLFDHVITKQRNSEDVRSRNNVTADTLYPRAQLKSTTRGSIVDA